MYLFEGKFFKARVIEERDAKFIFDLRRSERGYNLKPISDNIKDQYNYIKKSLKEYENKIGVYLIIEDLYSKKLGAFRLTNITNSKINYHSLICIPEIKPNIVLEVIFCVYQLFFEILKLNSKPTFEVPIESSKVKALHDKMGIAKEFKQDNKFYYFELSQNLYTSRKSFFLNLGYGLRKYENFKKVCKP